jgi:hypothetical protein
MPSVYCMLSSFSVFLKKIDEAQFKFLMKVLFERQIPKETCLQTFDLNRQSQFKLIFSNVKYLNGKAYTLINRHVLHYAFILCPLCILTSYLQYCCES